MNNQELGAWGEEQAVRYLTHLGYRIIALNYRTPLGELDVVASYMGALHFIEVKTRTSMTYGRPCEAVDYRKQKHIKRAAQLFLQDSGQAYFKEYDLSFDVIEIYKLGPHDVALSHMEACF